MGEKWTAADVPDQRGRVAVVTGANSGIGFEVAAVLGDNGARVVLMVRDVRRGEEAAERIRTRSPGADVDTFNHSIWRRLSRCVRWLAH